MDSRNHIGLFSFCVIFQVRKAAYQSLGPFISTFYDPDSYSSPEDYLGDKESPEQLLETDTAYQLVEQNTNRDINTNGEPAGLSGAYYNADGKNSPTDVKVECTSCACHMESAVKVNVTTSETLVSAEYSSFNFWKTPLPQVDDLELDSLTLEDKSVNSSSKTLHVHLTWSENKEKEDGGGVDSASTKNCEKQTEDTHTPVDNSQQHEHSPDTSSVTVKTDGPIVDGNVDTVHHIEINHDDNLQEDQCDNERTSSILVSDVVTNELGDEIIEISEIDVKEDDAITQQLSSLSSTNTGTAGNSGSSGLHIINNKTQAGWGSLPASSAEDTQDGGVISCLIPRVKITGVMNFDGHDDNLNYEPNDYYQKTITTGSQVDMEITLDGVEESLASKQVCNSGVVLCKCHH